MTIADTAVRRESVRPRAAFRLGRRTRERTEATTEDGHADTALHRSTPRTPLAPGRETDAVSAAVACAEGMCPSASPRPVGRSLEPGRLGDHLDRLYRAAWALCGSREDAEDLVQETYVRVLARPRLLRNDDDLGYLLRTLHNTFLTQRRNAARRPAGRPLTNQLDTLADPWARQPQLAAEAGELYAAVAALSPEFRDVLVAVDITGLSYKEAARALRLREGTVMSRLYRARRQVVRAIDGP
jgi:RNA polymerase sigma-70 factor (ECF subfamily)